MKYAVRYKGADEVIGVRAWPLGGATPGPRFLIPILPFMVLAVAPVEVEWPQRQEVADHALAVRARDADTAASQDDRSLRSGNGHSPSISRNWRRSSGRAVVQSSRVRVTPL